MLKTASELKPGDRFKMGKMRVFRRVYLQQLLPFTPDVSLDNQGKILITYEHRNYTQQMVVERNQVFIVE